MEPAITFVCTEARVPVNPVETSRGDNKFISQTSPQVDWLSILNKPPGPTGDTAKMPGKSNKFDYTNRPNSGPKLGGIIGNTLKKESEKHIKAAHGQTSKASKIGKGRKEGKVADGSTRTDPSETANKDHGLHVIDLKAPGKDLGDEGVIALCEGLEQAITTFEGDAAFALEDLNLSNNGITTAALPKLARVVAFAKLDLKTLDLSENAICVSTATEAAAWSTFLHSFGRCRKLRHLDLSGNELGERAMEVLARIHTRRTEGLSNVPDESFFEATPSPQRSSSSTSPPSTSVVSNDLDVKGYMDESTALDNPAGLRSIPFINLRSTAMTDAGALWLSYVMVDQPYPGQLPNGSNAPNLDTGSLDTQQGEDSCGITWQSPADTKLSRDGIGLLRKAEAVRKDNFMPEFDAEDEEERETRKDKRRDSRAAKGCRRVSYVNMPEEDLKSLRNKVQRSVICHEGPATVELWNAALQVIKSSRTLMALAPTTRRFYAGESLVRTAVEAPSTSPTEALGPPSVPSAVAHARTPSSTAAGLSKVFVDARHAEHKAEKRSYATTLAVSPLSGNSNSNSVAITEVTNTPRTPKLVLAHRKGGFSEGTDLHAATAKLQKLTTDGRDEREAAEAWLAFQKRMLGVWPYQDQENVTHLPPGVLRVMMVEIIGEGVEVLSDEQFKRAAEWGLDRETLAAEREWVKFDESNQIWLLLEKVGCLAY